jgi:hypothetical protein
MSRFRTLALVSVLTLGVAGLGIAASTTAPATQPGEERHPLIHKALHDLREAKVALTDAKHDYDGHRVKALEATDVAIKECELALKSDEK